MFLEKLREASELGRGNFRRALRGSGLYGVRKRVLRAPARYCAVGLLDALQDAGEDLALL